MNIDINNGASKYNFNTILLISLSILFASLISFYLFPYIKQNYIKYNKINILIGDIGGTYIRFNIIEIYKDRTIPQKKLDTTKLISNNFKSFEAVMEYYLKNKTNIYPSIAVIGIPGPVQENSFQSLINLPTWKPENGTLLQKKLKIKKFIFLNDFQCNSYGIQTNLKLNEDYIILNDAPPKKNAPKLIIGPGTGLGMGYLLKNPDDKYYIVGSSEGGHQDFPRKNKKFFELAEFVKKEYNLDIVTIEKVCSGSAMIPFFKFLLKENKNNINEVDKILSTKLENFSDYENKKIVNELNVEITVKGVSGECQLCRKVLELFMEILGEAAGDMALFTMSFGGIYLLGGISVAIEKLIKESKVFMEHYLNKDSNWILKKIPIYLIKNPSIGVAGAEEYARRIFEDEF